ncbi:MAG: 4Fe-4S binding protein [Planctomycetota bacterium]
MTRNIKRRIVQTVFAILFNMRLEFLFSAGIIKVIDKMRHFCVPAINCWSCPLSTFSCPIGALGASLSFHVIPFVLIGFLLIFGAVLGRFFCGWVCPFGLFQDLLNKIPTPKFRIPDKIANIRYLFLFAGVIIIPYFWSTDSYLFFCQYCPAGRLEAGIYEKAASPAFPEIWRLLVLIMFILLMLFSHRGFCRTICPLGALFGIFNKFSIFKMKLNKEKCTNCRWCHKVCPVDHKFNESDNSPDCIRCLNCKECKFDAVTSGLLEK